MQTAVCGLQTQRARTLEVETDTDPCISNQCVCFVCFLFCGSFKSSPPVALYPQSDVKCTECLWLPGPWAHQHYLSANWLSTPAEQQYGRKQDIHHFVCCINVCVLHIEK